MIFIIYSLLLNNDRIIFDFHNMLFDYIHLYENNSFSYLDKFNSFLFYFLYVSIILLGLLVIYKSKYLVKDSDQVISYLTTIIENGIKFSKK